jgi:hypothetical protein
MQSFQNLPMLLDNLSFKLYNTFSTVYSASPSELDLSTGVLATFMACIPPWNMVLCRDYPEITRRINAMERKLTFDIFSLRNELGKERDHRIELQQATPQLYTPDHYIVALQNCKYLKDISAWT